MLFSHLHNFLQYKDIKIGEDRLVYTSEEYDTSIIEIKKEKEEINNFLELDTKIFQNNSNSFYFGTSIYVLHYPGNKMALVSYDVLQKKGNEVDYEINHYCCTEKGSSGGPILSLEEQKVFGIHKSGGNFNYNKGTFLKYPVEEFISKIKNNNNKVLKKNEIEMKINIKEIKEKPFYFLYNTKEVNFGSKLNESNVELFINEKKSIFKNYFYPEKEGIYSIKLKLETNIEDCSYMFTNCENVTYINLSSFNTEKVTNMSYMFAGCRNLTSIDLSGIDTKNVTNMSYMFSGCRNLTSIDISGFYTNNVTDITNMFSYCENLSSINLSLFVTKNVNYMAYIFHRCINLTSIDLSGFDTKNVINMEYIFSGCYNLQNIKLKENFFKVNEQLKDENKEFMKKGYYLINSLLFEFSPNFAYKRIKKEVDDCLFEMGFQLFSLNNNTLYGVLEGPILTPYQNGFFLFKIIYSKNYPFKPPKFIFVSKIFHPNIDEEKGYVDIDIIKNKWSPDYTLKEIILSIQSLLSNPDIEGSLNENSFELYYDSKKRYKEFVKEYTYKFANYSLYKNELDKLKIKDKFEYI